MVEVIKSLSKRWTGGWGQGRYQLSSDRTQRLPGKCGLPRDNTRAKGQDVMLCDHTLGVWLEKCWEVGEEWQKGGQLRNWLRLWKGGHSKMGKAAERRPEKPEYPEPEWQFPDQGEVSITPGCECKKKNRTRNNGNKKQVSELFVRNSHVDSCYVKTTKFSEENI